MAEHTPGPWEIGIGKPARPYVIAWVDSEIVITAGTPTGGGPYPVDRETAMANGKLIIAAPDLLAACEAAELIMDTLALAGIGSLLPPAYRDGWAEAHMALQAAIAKARSQEVKDA